MKDCASHTEYGPGPESVPGLPVWGPPDYWFPTGVTHRRPIGQARGASEATSVPGDHPSKIQNPCQEPYYQAAPTGESLPAPACRRTGSYCLPPTKRPRCSGHLPPPPPNSEPVSLPPLISLLRDTHLHTPGPLEGATGRGGASSLCAW